MNSTTQDHIIHTIHTTHPNTQTIYLYGTWGTEYQQPNSDPITDLQQYKNPEIKPSSDYFFFLSLTSSILGPSMTAIQRVF